MSQNIQILVETMLRCGGNCSGCALSSIERMTKSDIDWVLFEQKTKSVNEFLKTKIQKSEIESVSIFLGQGDHFLMEEADIEQFVKYCSFMVPEEIKHKTVVLITASAIGKEKTIKKKMDDFFNISLKYDLPFFIQVVFDPKKMNLQDSFKKTYLNNILYFKEKCGMTELTLNLGDDLIENMTPLDFHNWLINYNFTHIEMNWVMNSQTHNMWKNSSKKMFDWLIEILEINAKDHKYEINFVPFLTRVFKLKKMENVDLIEKIKKDLVENIYIDNVGNITFGQAGLISNLIPLKQRLTKQNLNIDNIKQIEEFAQKISQSIVSKVLRKKSCVDCNYNNICSLIGSSAWFDFNKKEDGCPWDIKDFLIFFEKYLEKYPQYGKTEFDKNPIQDTKLEKENNATYQYFEKKFCN